MTERNGTDTEAVLGVRVVDVDCRAESRRLDADWAERTAIEQDLPATIEDEATLQEVASLLCAGREDARGISLDANERVQPPPARSLRVGEARPLTAPTATPWTA